MIRRHLPTYLSILFFGALVLFGCPGDSSETISIAPPRDLIREFPTVSLEGLSSVEREQFAKLMNEEVCPCKCPKTFAECLQSAGECKTGQIFAQWIAHEMGSGLNLPQMMGPVSKEISKGCVADPQTIETKGYHAKGAEKPEITIVEYADFNCLHCKTAAEVLNNFVSKHGDKVKLVFKYFPLEHMPRESMLAACAVEAAGKQGKFWQMHDAAFRSKEPLSREELIGHATALGLKVEQFKKDLDADETILKVQRAKNEGLKIGITGTPALFFNGRPYSLRPNKMADLETRLAMELARSETKCE